MCKKPRANPWSLLDLLFREAGVGFQIHPLRTHVALEMKRAKYDVGAL